jgi:dTDP-4-dehydrorhamnose reductase
MKILILGSTGQVGQAINKWLPTGMEIIAPVRDELDLSEIDALEEFLETRAPDLIINAAAYTNVDKAETEVDLAFTLNAKVPEVLAKYTGKRRARLIHYSTDYVFNGQGEAPWSETDTPDPINAYGKSKLAGEEAIQIADEKAIIFRTSWVFSANGSNFVRTILRLASQPNAIRIVDDQFGAPTSSWLIAHLSLRAAFSPSFPGGLYHLCSEGQTSWYDFGCQIIALAREVRPEQSWATEGVIPIASEQFPTPARRPRNSRLCCDKLELTLETTIPNWEDDLRTTICQILEEQR